MTGDPNKSVPLPSGPASLCFEKEEFMKENFNVDHFVLECRRRVQLEDLRDDLSVYLKILRSAMIELINKDYADFVNLSSNLVGMDKAIDSLKVPLEQLREEVMTVRMSMDEAIAAVEEKLRRRQQIKQKKECLQRLMNITQSVEKIERLLGIQSSEIQPTAPTFTGVNLNQDAQNMQFDLGFILQLNGQLIERVATEFNKLQFYVTKSRGLPLVEKIRPRIANITTTLQYSLEGSFLEGLDTGHVDMLRQCLRTYALIDKIKDAENLYRQHIVKPYMEEVISEQFIKTNHNGLKGMFDKIIQFIPQHCKLLTDVTSGITHGVEVVRGYDFIVNSVWPEVVSNIEAKTSSIFNPGNPNIFHAKYLISMEFLDKFEQQCGSQASVLRLREHPSYHTFVNKWSLPVYFQIRFQEIAGGFESSLFSAFNRSTDVTLFHLHSTHTLWLKLQQCWDKEIFIQPLCHRFWKLFIQLLMRYSSWLDEAYKEEIIDRSDTLTKPKPNSDKQVNGVESLPPGTHTEGKISPIPHSPPITIGQIISLVADAEKLTSMVPSLLEGTVCPRFLGLNEEMTNSFKDCVHECCSAVLSKLPQYRTYIVTDVTNQCLVHLKQVNDIPRLYRRTNRDVPTKPSTYIGTLIKPLTMFVELHEDVLGENQKNSIFVQVFSNLAEQYYTVTSDVLTSVKKMEDSLKRLKKVRGTDKAGGSQGMTDDDKIRQQLILDIISYGDQLSQFGVEKNKVENYCKLLELVEEAKSSMTTATTGTTS